MAHSLLLTRSGSHVATIAGVLGAAAVLAGGGGCLFTDPINMPPTIMIVPPTAVLIHEPASFKSTTSDPDGDALIVDWMHIPGDCSDDYSDPARWPFVDPIAEYVVADPADSFCVWASATDRHGAITMAVPYHATPVPEPPVAMIDIVRPVGATDPFPLYTDLEFSGAKSTHSVMDPLTFKWRLLPMGSPLGSQATLKDCPPDDTCLSPDMPGSYEVELTVVSSIDPKKMSVATKAVRVAADQLPCLGITTPGLDVATLAEDPAAEILFTVNSVVDDGDPYPVPDPKPPLVGTTHFSWFIGHGAAPARVNYIALHDFPSYTVPANDFSIGEEGRVRVEIHDRNPIIDKILLDCGDEDLCAGSKGCFQRMTWNIVFNR